MVNQRTLSSTISVTGRGIHSGYRVKLRLIPSNADTGIVFRRIDLPDSQDIKLNPFNVGATENNTAIGHGREAIHTVEHLLSSLYGLGINNVRVEIDNSEVPIMDGSAASFLFLLKEAGVTNLNKPKNFLIIKKKLSVEKDGKWAEIEPSDQLYINSTIVFPHPIIKTQRRQFTFSCQNYVDEISKARTFGFLKDVDMLKRKGLAKGGSLDNAVVLDDFNVVNAEGLRFNDEFIRHKILDTLGDLSLLGYDLIGNINTYKSGHNIHNLLCRKILDTPDSYEIVSSLALSSSVEKLYQLPQFGLLAV